MAPVSILQQTGCVFKNFKNPKQLVHLLHPFLFDLINPPGSKIKSQGESLLCDAGRGRLLFVFLLHGELEYAEFSPWKTQVYKPLLD